ncbi:uncharacterized protein DS421_7g219470 [Arachis hypogaea]|nr:uncharacterized protein DS421_7g219470 [Arachis hypogaea]
MRARVTTEKRSCVPHHRRDRSMTITVVILSPLSIAAASYHHYCWATVTVKNRTREKEDRGASPELRRCPAIAITVDHTAKFLLVGSTAGKGILTSSSHSSKFSGTLLSLHSYYVAVIGDSGRHRHLK